MTAVQARMALSTYVSLIAGTPAISFDVLDANNTQVGLTQAGHTFAFVNSGTSSSYGMGGKILILQDGVGGRTITAWTMAGGFAVRFEGGVAPVLSVAPNAVDVIEWYRNQGDIYVKSYGLAFA